MANLRMSRGQEEDLDSQQEVGFRLSASQMQIIHRAVTVDVWYILAT